MAEIDLCEPIHLEWLGQVFLLLILVWAMLPFEWEDLECFLEELPVYDESNAGLQKRKDDKNCAQLDDWLLLMPFHGYELEDGRDLLRWSCLPFLDLYHDWDVGTHAPDEGTQPDADSEGAQPDFNADSEGDGMILPSTMPEAHASGTGLEGIGDVMAGDGGGDHPMATVMTSKPDVKKSEPKKFEEKKMLDPVRSKKRECAGKYFGQSEYCGLKSCLEDGTSNFQDGKFHIITAIQLEVNKKAHLGFHAGEFDVYVNVTNSNKDAFRRKFRYNLQKELEKKHEPVEQPKPGTYYGTKLNERERTILQSYFVKSESKTTLDLTLNVNLNLLKTKTIEFEYGGVSVTLVLTNMGPMFRRVVGRVLKPKLNLSSSDIWTEYDSLATSKEYTPCEYRLANGAGATGAAGTGTNGKNSLRKLLCCVLR